MRWKVQNQLQQPTLNHSCKSLLNLKCTAHCTTPQHTTTGSVHSPRRKIGLHPAVRYKSSHTGSKTLGSLQGQARVVALAAVGGAVAQLLLGGVEQAPHQAEHDEDGPPLDAADSQDFSGAVAVQALVHLSRPCLWSDAKDVFEGTVGGGQRRRVFGASNENVRGGQ